MRTFEYSDDKSAKFWSIDLHAGRVEVTFGRIGSKGQTQTKEYADAAQAEAAHDKLIAEKLAKGYVEKPAAPPAHPTQLALEAALVERPDDLAAHAAYADFLAEQGDPRGELIQAQLGLESPGLAGPRRKQLQAREKQLLKRHAREWLGDLAPFLLDPDDDEVLRTRRYRITRGWLDTLEVGRLTVEFARALARAPQARLLRTLLIGTSQWHDDEDVPYEPVPDVPNETQPALFPLHRSPHLGNVRVLRLGEPPEEGGGVSYSSWCNTSFDGVLGLLKKMPNLEELYLVTHMDCRCKDLFALKTLGHLRVLQLYHKEEEHPLEVLARNPCLGRLTHLLIHPHGGGPYITLPGVRAVLRSSRLASLTHLQLRLSDMGDAGCREIVASGILKRLKVLDLKYGCVTDDGARVLAGCPDLRNLEMLELGWNWLTPAGVEALEGTGVNVQARDQSEEGDEQYLYEGDWE
jgi:uncharacterized protein (TIGR02996 family)